MVELDAAARHGDEREHRLGPVFALRSANLERARAALGGTTYEEAYREGTAMSREGALAYALDLL